MIKFTEKDYELIKERARVLFDRLAVPAHDSNLLVKCYVQSTLEYLEKMGIKYEAN